MYSELHKTVVTIVIILVLVIPVLSGCMQEAQLDEPERLIIMANDKDTFNKVYGTILNRIFPEVEFHIIDTLSLRQDTTPEEKEGQKLMTFIEQEHPDLILLEPDQVIPLADEGKLLELDPIMKQHQFYTTGISDSMLGYFRQIGNGSLYAIAPKYTPTVIYYNKDLFNKYDIEHPTNQMTWEQLFSLGQRFGQLEEEKPIYGLADHLYANRMTSILNLAQANQLSITDPSGKTIQLQSEGWINVYKTVTGAMKKRALYTSDQEVMSSSANDNPFARGEVAMQVHVPVSSKYSLIGESTAQIGVVTMTVDSSNPEQSSFINLESMYAINAASDHKELAWKVLDYMLGKDMATTNLHNFIATGSLPIRDAHIQTVGEWDVQPYVMLKPTSYSGSPGDVIWRSKLSDTMKKETVEAMAKAVDQIVKQKESIEVLLTEMNDELQVKLDTDQQ